MVASEGRGEAGGGVVKLGEGVATAGGRGQGVEMG